MVKSQDPRRSLRRHEQFFASAHMNSPDRDTRWRSWLRRSCLATAIAVGMLHNLGAAAEPPQASEAAAPVETPATESHPSPDPGPVEVDPSVTLKGAVWRTKAGIVFLKTPVGLLTLSSKTTLKDLKGSHEVSFWVHERHFVVEIRRRSDASLVHRYLGGPMTLGPDSSKTLRYWSAEGEQTVHYGTQEAKLGTYHEGDQVTSPKRSLAFMICNLIYRSVRRRLRDRRLMCSSPGQCPRRNRTSCSSGPPSAS